MTGLMRAMLLAGLLVTALMPAVGRAAEASPPIWQELPVPPVPPAKPPATSANGFQPAPIPNPDAKPPRSPGASADPSLTPGLFMPPDRFAGDGYTPGSTVQGEQERHLKPGAGLNLRLPFE